MKIFAAVAALTLLALAAAPESQAQAKGEAWLTLLDNAKYGESWSESSSLFRSHVDQQKWSQMVGAVRGPLGAKISRKLKSITFAKTLPGVPDGSYGVMIFDASFANKASATETLTMMDEAGEWRAAGYFIR